jgi:hypothetical protein
LPIALVLLAMALPTIVLDLRTMARPL